MANRAFVSLFVLLSIISLTSAQKCSFQVGQVWRGLYRGSERPLGQQEVAITITGPSTWREVSTYATFDVAYGVSSKNQLKLRDFETSTPPLLACAPSSVGVYNLNFSSDCRSFSLTVDTDFCARRLVHLHKILLSLEDTQAPCEFNQGETWRGYYPDNNVLVGKMVNFHFQVGSQVTEDSSEATINALWSINADRDLVTRDVNGVPLLGQFLCPVGSSAVYSLTFSNQCNQVTLKLKNDPCGVRRERYNNLVLTKVSSQCTFQSGSVWTAVLPGNDPVLSGRPLTVQVEDGMAVTASINRIKINQFWFLDSYGDLRTRDLGSCPSSSYACPRTALSQYAVTWANNCTEALLDLVRDDCVVRANLYSGLRLKKVPAASDPPVIMNFNFDKLVPASARPCFKV